MKSGAGLMESIMKSLLLTLPLLAIGFVATPQNVLASPFAPAKVAIEVPTQLQEAYVACRWGPYGRRCSRVRPYAPYAYYRPYRPYRPYAYSRPYYRPYNRYGYGY